MYLVRAPAGLSRQGFAALVMERLVPDLEALRPDRLTIHITDSDPPFLSVIPFKKDLAALVSIGDSAADRAAEWTECMETAGGTLSGYRVTETVPVTYERNWPDGTPTPGAGLLTLLNRNPKLSYPEFMDEWFGRHTPMSLRIHPMWHYERNVVEEEIVPGSPHFDGIVEEHFRTRADLFNPVRFFGGPLKMLPHMVEVGLHVNRFLDLPSLENYLVGEIHIIT